MLGTLSRPPPEGFVMTQSGRGVGNECRDQNNGCEEHGSRSRPQGNESEQQEFDEDDLTAELVEPTLVGPGVDQCHPGACRQRQDQIAIPSAVLDTRYQYPDSHTGDAKQMQTAQSDIEPALAGKETEIRDVRRFYWAQGIGPGFLGGVLTTTISPSVSCVGRHLGIRDGRGTRVIIAGLSSSIILQPWVSSRSIPESDTHMI